MNILTPTRTTIITTLLAAVIVLSVVSFAEANAAPYYTKKTTHKIVALVKFDSDCWEEIYARAVPKGHNGVVLNKQTVYNNDRPDAGPSEIIKFVWYFNIKKQTDTGEDRTRMYVEIEFPNGAYGNTVHKFKTFGTDDYRWDFGIFNMKTDKSLCK